MFFKKYKKYDIDEKLENEIENEEIKKEILLEAEFNSAKIDNQLIHQYQNRNKIEEYVTVDGMHYIWYCDDGRWACRCINSQESIKISQMKEILISEWKNKENEKRRDAVDRLRNISGLTSSEAMQQYPYP